MNEYELAGIEVIARGVCVIDGKILLCKAKGGKTTYLPGGHIGLDSTTGAFLGVVENSFLQHGKPHAEINLVYELSLAAREVEAREDWIEFEWRQLDDLGDLLPEAFRKLGADPSARFEP